MINGRIAGITGELLTKCHPPPHPPDPFPTTPPNLVVRTDFYNMIGTD